MGRLPPAEGGKEKLSSETPQEGRHGAHLAWDEASIPLWLWVAASEHEGFGTKSEIHDL